MIRNKYTNSQIKKIPKYNKFLLFRSFNSIVLFFLYFIALFNAIRIVNQTPIYALMYMLIFSFIIYFIIVVNDKALYGLYTSLKNYQAHMLEVVSNKKSKHGFLSLFNTLFMTTLLYVLVTSNIYVVGAFALISLVVQMVLVDTADLPKILKLAKKFDVDISEYRVLDNDVFHNLTKEQVFYVHCTREKLLVSFALNKQLDAKRFKAELDEEEYIFISMLAKQMEKLGK